MTNLIEDIDKIGEMILINSFGMEDITVNGIKKDGIVFSRIHLVLITCPFLSAVLYCIGVPIESYLRGSYRQDFPLPNFCSFELYPPIYEVTVFFQVPK